MTIEEAKEILQRDLQILIDNKSLPDGIEAMNVAISALGTLEQVRWERDVAVSQLNELGLSLGQKVDHVKELIDKNTENEAIDKSKNPTDWHVMHCPTCDRIFWNSGQFMHYEPKYCEKCGQKMLWKKNPYSVG